MKQIEIDNVLLSFDKKTILQAIYLKAEKGKITGILGRNGSGKTSLLRILFGELKPENKHIRIDENFIKEPLYSKGVIKYLPQFNTIPSSLSLQRAFEFYNVSIFSFLKEFPNFKLKNKMLFHQFSGGERRLIESYLTLLSNSPIILLDEPFSHIEPLYISILKEILNKVKHNKIVIITDHFCEDILEVSDTVYFIKNGHIKKIENRQSLIDQGYIN